MHYRKHERKVQGEVMKKQRRSISTTHAILLSFVAVILVGAGLLSLPISAANGQSVSFLDALFTATTSTCVTGLVVAPTVSTWSVFGQAVILGLIEVGGLGVITVMSAVMILLHKKMGIGDRLLLQDAFNLNSLSGIVRFVKKVVVGTLVIEGAGALMYMTVFVPEFGARGIWISVFTSVSAFCNAGIDIIAENSLCNYATDPVVNLVTSALIVLGGIGYVVWWDVLEGLRRVFSRRGPFFSRLMLHTKIALAATAVLIVSGAALILCFEYNNPATLQNHSLWEKIQIAFFQSVTTRTAGFASIPQENLTGASALVCLLWMFIGGSPAGTAGGVKTVTFVLLIASAISGIRNKEDTELFGRRLKKEAVTKAAAVLCMAFATVFVSTVLLSTVTDAPVLDVMYETVSATATVGLSRGMTPSLGMAGKWILIVTMYLGRVGPISSAIALNWNKQNPNSVRNPTEDVIVG